MYYLDSFFYFFAVEALLDELDSAVTPTGPAVAPKPPVYARPNPTGSTVVSESPGSPKTGKITAFK